MPQPYKVFVIYAREDADYLKEMLGHLRPLVQAGRITVWSDREINPGAEWEKAIIEQLDHAEIVLVLVSAAYYSSAYIHEKEITRAHVRHQKGDTRLLPVIVRPVSFDVDPVINSLQCLPTDGKPIADWPSRDRGWVDVVSGLRRILDDLLESERAAQLAFEAAERERIEKLPETQLLRLIDRSIEVFQALKLDSLISNALQLEIRVRRKSFKLLVVGMFNTGKSTFLNALLGQEILPAFRTIPTTAVITEIKYGLEPKAILHFKNPVDKLLPSNIHPEAKAHLEKFGSNPVLPMSIRYEDLERYMSITDADPTWTPYTPFSLIELFWPLEMLKNGMELIDSPGLDQSKTYTEVTTKYLKEADAILFVLTCAALFSKSEQEFIKNDLNQSGHHDVFFICNHIDQVPEKEHGHLKEFAMTKLHPLTDLQNGIHFLSSNLAIQGKIENNPQKLDQSGILPLELLLIDFITYNPSRIKVLQPSRMFLQYITITKYKIVNFNRDFNSKLKESTKKKNEFAKRYEEAKILIASVEDDKIQILESIEDCKQKLEKTTCSQIKVKLQSIGMQIPGWTENMEVENKIKLLSFEQKKDMQALSEEVSRKILEKMKTELNQWKTDELEPQWQELSEGMYADLKTKIENFYDKMERIDTILSDFMVYKGNWYSPPVGKNQFLLFLEEEVLKKNGSKGLVDAILTNIAIGIGLLLVNPFLIYNAFFSNSKINDLVKKQVGEKTKDELFRNIIDQVDQIVYKASASFAKMKDGADNLLKVEINNCTEHIQSLFISFQKEVDDIRNRVVQLTQIEQKTLSIEHELQHLIQEVEMTPPKES